MSQSAGELFALLGELPRKDVDGPLDDDFSPPSSPSYLRGTDAAYPAELRDTADPSPSGSLARNSSRSGDHTLPDPTGHSVPPVSGRFRATTSNDDLGTLRSPPSAADKRVSAPTTDVLELFAILTRDLERDPSALDPQPAEASRANALDAPAADSVRLALSPRDLIEEMLAAQPPEPPSLPPPPPSEPARPAPLPSQPPVAWAFQPPPAPISVDDAASSSESTPSATQEDPFAVFQRELRKAAAQESDEGGAEELPPAESPSSAILKAIEALSSTVAEGHGSGGGGGGGRSADQEQDQARSSRSPSGRRASAALSLEEQLNLLRYEIKESGSVREAAETVKAGLAPSEALKAEAPTAEAPPSPGKPAASAGPGELLKPRKAGQGRLNVERLGKATQPAKPGPPDAPQQQPVPVASAAPLLPTTESTSSPALQPASPPTVAAAAAGIGLSKPALRPVKIKSDDSLAALAAVLAPAAAAAAAAVQLKAAAAPAVAAAAAQRAPSPPPGGAAAGEPGARSVAAAQKDSGGSVSTSNASSSAAAGVTSLGPAAVRAEGLVDSPTAEEADPPRSDAVEMALAAQARQDQTQAAATRTQDALNALKQRAVLVPLSSSIAPAQLGGGAAGSPAKPSAQAPPGELPAPPVPSTPTVKLSASQQALSDALEQQKQAAAREESEHFSLSNEAASSSGAFGSLLGAITSYFGISSLKGVAMLPNGGVTCVASGSDDGTVKLWNPRAASCFAVLRGHKGAVTCLAPLYSGSVASGSSDRTVIVWDRKSFAPVVVLRGHTQAVTALCVYDDLRLISASDDCTLRVWRISPGDCLRVVRQESSITTVQCLSDGQIFCGSLDQKLRCVPSLLISSLPPRCQSAPACVRAHERACMP